MYNMVTITGNTVSLKFAQRIERKHSHVDTKEVTT